MIFLFMMLSVGAIGHDTFLVIVGRWRIPAFDAAGRIAKPSYDVDARRDTSSPDPTLPVR